MLKIKYLDVVLDTIYSYTVDLDTLRYATNSI